MFSSGSVVPEGPASPARAATPALQFAEPARPEPRRGSFIGTGAPVGRTLSLGGISLRSVKTSVSQTTSSGSGANPEIPVRCAAVRQPPPHRTAWLTARPCIFLRRYRTVSIHVSEEVPSLDVPAEADLVRELKNVDHHLVPTSEVYARYGTDPDLGLSSAALKKRIAENGGNLEANVISPPKTNYFFKFLGYVFGGFNFLMWIAFIMVLLSYQPLGQPNPAIFNLGVAMLILFVIILSSFFYAFVDFQSSRVMRSIRNLIATEASVTRNGTRQQIKAQELVVGDLVHVSLGVRVPADLRLVNVSADLKFDRSLLTGESDPVPGAVDATDKNPLETRNLALSSTFVVQGSGTGIVVSIGDNSVMGSIANLAGGQKQQRTPIQQEIWRFTIIISSAAVTLFTAAIVFWAAFINPRYPGYLNVSGAIINAIGVLTAFVPQGLPLCVALAMTVIGKPRRMAARSVLVKNLATVETLGCMSVLCSDKTGTLTQGKMMVVRAAVSHLKLDFEVGNLLSLAEVPHLMRSPSDPAVSKVHECAALCCGASFDVNSMHLPIDQRTIRGDSTDAAVLRFAESIGPVDDAWRDWEKVFEVPFNSKNKWMMSVVKPRFTPGASKLFVKGAPDILIPACSLVLNPDGSVSALDLDAQATVVTTQEQWASEGLRVLALCAKDTPADLPYDRPGQMETVAPAQVKELTLLGLIALADPPRPDVTAAVANMRGASVRVFMVTGDFRLTAVAVAKSVGIITAAQVDSLSMMQENAELVNKFKDLKPEQIRPDFEGEVRALVVDGSEIATMKKEDWDVAIGAYREMVFARTTPEHKLRIVEEIRKRGDNVVGVTGDGVNDSPALKAANVGVAMGAGSDVAKEAAALVLLNNDFASIPVAIENGRLLFDNLKKVLAYLMPAGTYCQFTAIFLNSFLGSPLSLSGYQQIIFCITNDVAMSLAIMFEKAESDLMHRPPRNARTDKLTDWRYFVQVYLFIGLMMWPFVNYLFFRYMYQAAGIGISDLIFAYGNWTDGYLGYSQDQLNAFQSVGQTIFYVALCMFQIGNIFAVRNRRMSTLQSNPLWGPSRQNIWIFGSISASIIIAIINVYGPGIQSLFGVAVIPWEYWLIPLAYSVGILVVDEVRKVLVRAYPQSWIGKAAW
ncbi:calcium ATPase transmembrane domain M-containing protein [Hyaloraphidium curvatum]|nr:calcium ATPase transmembrane domain M-containing protein [Hyaloraphidium curvatum]